MIFPPRLKTTGRASTGGSAAPGRAAGTIAARLTFERLERRFDTTIALNDFSLDIAPAEVVCLLGPSGCGKTTLFQDFALFPHLTIIGNVAFGLRALPREDARREAAVALARVGLTRYADDYPHILSGGEQQRVALARAIVPRPAVMLMDEPFSGLDVQLRERLQEETLTLLRETRATCLIVTHAPAEAIRLGDRIAVMRAGRLLQAGKAEELYRNPADLFVARLFSEINEIPYTVESGALRTPIGAFAVPGLNEGEEAILCIRRRAIRIGSAGAGLPARLLRSQFLGDLALLEVAVHGFERPLLTVVREGEQPRQGQEVSISVDAESVLVFPAHAPAADNVEIMPSERERP